MVTGGETVCGGGVNVRVGFAGVGVREAGVPEAAGPEEDGAGWLEIAGFTGAEGGAAPCC
jgi:hypothetical protein